jgi:hypothetical protein
MIEAVEELDSWICTIWNLRCSLHYEFNEEQTFVIISRDELEKMGLNDYKVYRQDEDNASGSDSD